MPVLLKLDPKVARPRLIAPISEKMGRDIDCFVGTNLEFVEASVPLVHSELFLVAPEEVLDDLLAVEDVDF